MPPRTPSIRTKERAAYFEERAEKLYNDYTQRVEKLAEEIRQELVIPLCKKYNLQFLSGNGSFSFYTKRGLRGEWESINCADDAENVLGERAYMAFLECFEALNAQVGQTHNVGMYCGDVDNGPGTEVE